MQRQDDRLRGPRVVGSPTALPCLRSLPSKAKDLLSVFTGDDKTLPTEVLDHSVLGFPDSPCSGPDVAAAALYGHDQGDRKRVLKQLSFALTHIPRRGYLLNADAARMSSRSWWLLTKRKQRLLASMAPQVLVPLLRPTWVLEALQESKRVDLDKLRSKGAFSGAMLSTLADLEYSENGNSAVDLRELVEARFLRRHNHGFLPDQWPPDAEFRPITIDELLRVAKESDRFFARPSQARDRVLKELGVPVPELKQGFALRNGIWMPTPATGFTP